MSVAGRKAFHCFLLLIVSASLCVVTVRSLVTSCNLNAENKECVQHCERSENGDDDCALSCKRNSTSSLLYCSQLCDPKDGNGKKCSFHCDVKDECVQQCTPGHCRHLKCSKNVENCEQICTAGNCKNMVCDSRKCFQNCRSGGCNMKCGPNVEYCEQICPGGNCRMTCEGKTCRAYCPLGTCHTRGPNSAILTSCSIRGKHRCVQSCPANGCYCKAAGRLRSCKQACTPESCRSITCHARVCQQNCGSNCSLTCSADHCTQECSGSGCHFQCSEKVQSCKQICKKGNCVFNCAAKKCEDDCPGGNCIFNKVGDAVGMFLDAKCDYRHNGQCEPLCKECIFGGYDLKCAGSNNGECNQNCVGGSCKNVTCAAEKQCHQFCAGGRCDAMDCKSKKCMQRCPGGKCLEMKCTADKCTQTCLGNCERMTCDSKECEQDCFLGGCSLECSKNVSKCIQKCHTGHCTFKCDAQVCLKLCPDGKCIQNLVGGTGRSLADVYFLLLTSVSGLLFLYINM